MQITATARSIALYALAYVIIPTRFQSLQAVLDASLAPFRRGGPDLFPLDRLTFDDVTEKLRVLQTKQLSFHVSNGGLAIDGIGSENFYDLNTEALRAVLDAWGVGSWSG